MSDLRLEDLRILTEFDGSMTRTVTAAEVASACPTEVLIEVLIERGVLVVERDADGNWKLPQDTDRDKWHHGLIAAVLDDLAAAARREAST